MKKKAAHSEDMLGFYGQVVPKTGRAMMQLEPSGKISVDVAGLYPFEHGAVAGSSL